MSCRRGATATFLPNGNESQAGCGVRGALAINRDDSAANRIRCAGEPMANQRRNAGTTRNGIIPSTTLTSENPINGP
jgi:hypothetical protein